MAFKLPPSVGYVLGVFFCLYVVCVCDNSKNDEDIYPNFSMCVQHDKQKKSLNFGKDLDHTLDR